MTLHPIFDPDLDEVMHTPGRRSAARTGPRHGPRSTERTTAMQLAQVRKAVVAGVGALSASLVTGGADGALSWVDWALALFAGASVGWATYKTTNAPVPPVAPPVDEHVGPDGA